MTAVAFLGDATTTPAQARAAVASATACFGSIFTRYAADLPPDVIAVLARGASGAYAPRDRAEMLKGAAIYNMAPLATPADATAERATMTDSATHQFIWIDLETTGLDPTAGRVLEFATVLCEDARGDDFAAVQTFAGVIGATAAELDALPIDPVVHRMHDANGLWRDVLANAASESPTTEADVDEFLASVAEGLTGGRKRAIVLAGSSVHFDRAWCAVHFPRFTEYLSHRVFDVTTLRRAVDAWAPTPAMWPKRDAHRALDDVLATIAEARVARAAMFGGGAVAP